MLSFSNFITESENFRNGMSPATYNHMWHLTSDMMGEHPYDDINEEGPIPTLKPKRRISQVGDADHSTSVVKRGLDNEDKRQASSELGLRGHIKAGFHAAFPDGEDSKTTHTKAKEAQKHFRNFMTKEGGHSEKNKLNLLGQNGKTKSSAGAGRNTVGLTIAPHTSASTSKGHDSSGHFDVCPNATKECRKNCLGFTAGGNKQYPETAFKSKVLRQRYMQEHPEHHARLLSHEISDNEKWTSDHTTIHKKDGTIVGIRIERVAE